LKFLLSCAIIHKLNDEVLNVPSTAKIVEEIFTEKDESSGNGQQDFARKKDEL
jgi:hypothetical protein